MEANKSVKEPRRKVSKFLRNVLAIPQESFWPLPDPVEIENISSLLSVSLKYAQVNKPKLPWAEAQSISKQERKEKEKELIEKLPEAQKIEIKKAMAFRSNLHLGVNALLTGIEQSTVHACLVASNASPMSLIKHVVTVAFRMGVPIILLPNLKTVTKESLGFHCLAVGFKNEVEEKTHIFNEAYLNIKTLGMSMIEKAKKEHPELILDKAWFPEENTSDEEEGSGEQVKVWHYHRGTSEKRVFSALSSEEENNADYIPIEISGGTVKVKIDEETDRKTTMVTDRGNQTDSSPIAEGSTEQASPQIQTEIKEQLHRVKITIAKKNNLTYKPAMVITLSSNPDKFKKNKSMKKK